jgi:hypothetical protein
VKVFLGGVYGIIEERIGDISSAEYCDPPQNIASVRRKDFMLMDFPARNDPPAFPPNSN